MAKLMEFTRVETLYRESWQNAPCVEGIFYIVRNRESDPPGKITYVRYRCPCGCGDIVALPVSEEYREEEVWGCKIDTAGRATLDPSVQHIPPENNGGAKCRSHYFIRESRVEWCE